MLKIPMGRNEGLIGYHDAARMLDVTSKHFSYLVRQGHIRPAKIGRRLKDARYRVSDLEAYLNARGRGMDLAQTASTAIQARSIALSATERLEKICLYLGLENNRLRTDEESVYQLYVRVAEELRTDVSDMAADAIMEWASILNGIDEAYLQLLEYYTKAEHPWENCLNLANAIMAQQGAVVDANTRFAYACLDAARRSLRHVSYFYVLTRSGERVAADVFRSGTVDEEIIAQLYPSIEYH